MTYRISKLKIISNRILHFRQHPPFQRRPEAFNIVRMVISFKHKLISMFDGFMFSNFCSCCCWKVCMPFICDQNRTRIYPICQHLRHCVCISIFNNNQKHSIWLRRTHASNKSYLPGTPSNSVFTTKHKGFVYLYD